MKHPITACFILVGLTASSILVEAADDGLTYQPTFQSKSDDELQISPGSERYIVCPANDKGRQTALENADQFHLEMKSVNCVAVSMPAARAAALGKNPNIAKVEVDEKRYPVSIMPSLRGASSETDKDNDESITGGDVEEDHHHTRRLGEEIPYGITTVQADQVSYQGGRKVCIIDSGYENGHEDLPTLNTSNGGKSGSTSWYTDGCQHGTHVAGTIAAIKDNNLGVVGVAPGVEIYIVKVFADNCGWTYSSGLVGALADCESAGANVVSMSLGGGAPTSAENNAFAAAFGRNVLSIAAAGNGGNTALSYPASYASVMSVAATDSANVLASFSQRNSQVEIAAPGVAVRSTVGMGRGSGEESVTVGGNTYSGGAMDGSPAGTVTASLFACSGLGNPGDCTGATGKICLIQRGDISFAAKVLECQGKGGVTAIIYNNVVGPLSGTLGGTATNIPSIGISQADGATLLNNNIGQSATVTIEASGNYAFYDGTSMATPHVSGVAALVWSHNPSCTAQEIRTALTSTALDLGAAGRDTSYGFGLVQAADALAGLSCGGGSPPATPPPTTPPPTNPPPVCRARGTTCTANSQCCSSRCKRGTCS